MQHRAAQGLMDKLLRARVPALVSSLGAGPAPGPRSDKGSASWSAWAHILTPWPEEGTKP